MLLIGAVPYGLGQHDHGVIIDPVIISCRFLSEFTVFITVDAFPQIGKGCFLHLPAAKEPAAGHQNGRNGPAVVRRVKASPQKALCPLPQDMLHLFQDAALMDSQLRRVPLLLTAPILLPALSVPSASQILIHGQQLLHAERRIRRGEKVAGNIIEQPIVMLDAYDIIQPFQDTVQYPPVLIIAGVLITIGSYHACCPVDCELGLHDSVGIRESSISRAVLLKNLYLQGSRHPVLCILNHSLVMSLHVRLPLRSPISRSKHRPVLHQEQNCQRLAVGHGLSLDSLIELL